MTLNDFVEINNIRPADAVVLRKHPYRLLDHYLIYLGVDQFSEHKFIANYNRGIQILTNEELAKYSMYMDPVRINRFVGNEADRQTAIQRALSRLDERSYSLILNNCEHYSSFVQRGENCSKQTQALGTGLAAAGLITAVAGRNNPRVRTAGLVAAGLGLLTLLLDND